MTRLYELIGAVRHRFLLKRFLNVLTSTFLLLGHTFFGAGSNLPLCIAQQEKIDESVIKERAAKAQEAASADKKLEEALRVKQESFPLPNKFQVYEDRAGKYHGGISADEVLKSHADDFFYRKGIFNSLLPIFTPSPITDDSCVSRAMDFGNLCEVERCSKRIRFLFGSICIEWTYTLFNSTWYGTPTQKNEVTRSFLSRYVDKTVSELVQEFLRARGIQKDIISVNAQLQVLENYVRSSTTLLNYTGDLSPIPDPQSIWKAVTAFTEKLFLEDKKGGFESLRFGSETSSLGGSKQTAEFHVVPEPFSREMYKQINESVKIPVINILQIKVSVLPPFIKWSSPENLIELHPPLCHINKPPTNFSEFIEASTGVDFLDYLVASEFPRTIDGGVLANLSGNKVSTSVEPFMLTRFPFILEQIASSKPAKAKGPDALWRGFANAYNKVLEDPFLCSRVNAERGLTSPNLLPPELQWDSTDDKVENPDLPACIPNLGPLMPFTNRLTTNYYTVAAQLQNIRGSYLAYLINSDKFYSVKLTGKRPDKVQWINVGPDKIKTASGEEVTIKKMPSECRGILPAMPFSELQPDGVGYENINFASFFPTTAVMWTSMNCCQKNGKPIGSGKFGSLVFPVARALLGAKRWSMRVS